MAKFRLTVTIGLIGCKRTREFEVDDEDIEGKSEDEVLKVAYEYGEAELTNIIDWDVERIEGE